MLRIKSQTNELITYATQDNLNKALTYAELLVASISDRIQAQMDIEDEDREEGGRIEEREGSTYEYELR